MYIDDERVKPDVAVPLNNGNVICFGVNTVSNELKYTFVVCKEPKTAALKRCGIDMIEGGLVESSPSLSPSPSPPLLKAKRPSPSPPLLKGKRGLSEDQRNKTEQCAPKKKPRLSDPSPSPSAPLLKAKHGLSEDQHSKTEECAPKKKPRVSDEKNKTSPSVKIKGRGSLEKAAVVERDCMTPKTKKLETSVLSILTSTTTNKSALGPNISPVISVPSSKPSPALSITSTKSTSDIDELFEGGETKCSTAILDEAIFGESMNRGSKVLKEHRGLDATSLQIQLAKDQMEKEKHKLLSSIEALRSELAAKDQLLAEKDEKTKAAEDVGNSVMSSMQEEFTCVICQELFINAYTLPCAHSFCEWCIKEWMKRKGHKDCPICREKITSDPVHSLALDNAVSKLVEKLSADEQKERKETEMQHKNSLEGLKLASMTARMRTSVASGTSRIRTRSSMSSAGVAVISSSSSATPHIVIDLSSDSPRRTAPSHPIRIDTSTESESDSDSDDSSDSSDSDSSDPGVVGAYYGGYGRCFNCGKLL